MLLAYHAFCPRCGHPNPSGYPFCSNCGTVLTPVGVPPTTPPPAAPPPSGYGPSPPPGYAAPSGYYAWPIRRATAGNMIADTFQVFGRNLLQFIVPYIVFAAATVGITVALTYWAFGVPQTSVTPGTTTFPGAVDLSTLYVYLGLVVLTAIISAVIGAILTGSLTYFAVLRHRGAAVRLADALDQGLRRFLSILGATILISLIVAGLLTVPLGILLVAAFTQNLALLALGLLLMVVTIPFLIFVMIALEVYAPTIMMEGQSALGSLKRSWELTRGRRLSIFAAVLVIGILGALVGAVAGIGGLFDGIVAVYVIQVIVSGIVGSWSVILSAVAYSLIISDIQMPYWMPPPGVPAPAAPPTPPGAP